MVEIPETPGDGTLDALSFLAAAYDTESTNDTGTGDMSGLIEGAVEDAMASSDDPVQKLLNAITALTNILGGMTILARALLAKCAELTAVEPEEILEGFRRQINPPNG
jgi:hypothetical protein